MPAPTPPPSIDDVCLAALRLPCSPALLPRLSEALQSESSSTGEISRIIQIDPALASSTLRLANSAFFGGGNAVETVEQAILRLGAKEIYRLAALALLGRWPVDKHSGCNWEASDFCRHALCCAIATEVLAEITTQVDPQVAYTAGLTHELGKLALAHSCGAWFPLIRACQTQRQATWEAAEKEILGYEHAEVGARLLRAWRFPENLVATAEFQHRPSSAPAPALPLLVHLHAGRLVAASMGPGISEDGFLFQVNGHLLLEWNFTPSLLEEAMLVSLDRASRRLGEKLSHGQIKY
ncbi:MAG: HDOD domain-containing protein [Opitutae bacterium]|nr:HDOD domain-containing protein [Opitutae bacterium]